MLIVDGQLEGLTGGEITARAIAFRPDFTVVTTAPSYLFWRCAPPELRIPQETVRALGGSGGTLVGIGPHGSTTPRTTLRKLGVDVVVLGEPEEILPQLAGKTRAQWGDIPALCYLLGGEARIQSGPHASDMGALPALDWPTYMILRHHHHHHRFDVPPWGPGAEIEASRGCPYRCSFCAKENFRDRYRRRPDAAKRLGEELRAILGRLHSEGDDGSGVKLPERSLAKLGGFEITAQGQHLNDAALVVLTTYIDDEHYLDTAVHPDHLDSDSYNPIARLEYPIRHLDHDLDLETAGAKACDRSNRVSSGSPVRSQVLGCNEHPGLGQRIPSCRRLRACRRHLNRGLGPIDDSRRRRGGRCSAQAPHQRGDRDAGGWEDPRPAHQARP